MIIVGTRSGKASLRKSVKFKTFSEDNGTTDSTTLRTVVRKMKARGRVVVFAFSIKHGTILDSDSIADPRAIPPADARKLLQRAVVKAFAAGLAAGRVKDANASHAASPKRP